MSTKEIAPNTLYRINSSDLKEFLLGPDADRVALDAPQEKDKQPKDEEKAKKENSHLHEYAIKSPPVSASPDEVMSLIY